MGQTRAILFEACLDRNKGGGQSAVTLSAGCPVYTDARTMRIVLDEMWQALREPGLVDRNYLIAILAGRDARTSERIEGNRSPGAAIPSRGVAGRAEGVRSGGPGQLRRSDQPVAQGGTP